MDSKYNIAQCGPRQLFTTARKYGINCDLDAARAFTKFRDKIMKSNVILEDWPDFLFLAREKAGMDPSVLDDLDAAVIDGDYSWEINPRSMADMLDQLGDKVIQTLSATLQEIKVLVADNGSANNGAAINDTTSNVSTGNENGEVVSKFVPPATLDMFEHEAAAALDRIYSGNGNPTPIVKANTLAAKSVRQSDEVPVQHQRMVERRAPIAGTSGDCPPKPAGVNTGADPPFSVELTPGSQVPGDDFYNLGAYNAPYRDYRQGNFHPAPVEPGGPISSGPNNGYGHRQSHTQRYMGTQSFWKMPTRRLPSFDGKGNFFTFLSQFDSFIEDCHCQEQAASIFAECLRGEAADLYATFPHSVPKDIKSIRSRFRAFFDNIDVRVLKRQLRDLTQRSGESYSEFARRVSIMAHRAFVNEDDAEEHGVDTFIRGILNYDFAYELRKDNVEYTRVESVLKRVEYLDQSHQETMRRKSKAVKSVTFEDSGSMKSGISDSVLDCSVQQVFTSNRAPGRSECLLKLIRDCARDHTCGGHGSENPIRERSGSPSRFNSPPRVSRGVEQGASDRTPRQEQKMSSGSTSFRARSRSPSPARNSAGGCYGCGETGHFIRECPRSPNRNASPRRTPPRDAK